MIPIAIDPARVRIGLVGRGQAAARRLEMLRNAGADVTFHADPPDTDTLGCLRLLWVVGLPEAEALAVAERARAVGVLVNVEDVRAGCDYHNVAEVRRGDLLLTVSTNGRSPGLAAMIKTRLAEAFGPEWSMRLERVSARREVARASGKSPAEVSAETAALVGKAGWLL